MYGLIAWCIFVTWGETGTHFLELPTNGGSTCCSGMWSKLKLGPTTSRTGKPIFWNLRKIHRLRRCCAVRLSQTWQVLVLVGNVVNEPCAEADYDHWKFKIHQPWIRSAGRRVRECKTWLFIVADHDWEDTVERNEEMTAPSECSTTLKVCSLCVPDNDHLALCG